MKLIHCADLHLDSKMESSLPAASAKERRKELLETYDRMVEFAVQNGVSVIMITGDLFDKTHIRKKARNRVLERMYENPQIDFLYLQGNHDMSDFLLGLDMDELPDNLKIFSKDEWTSYTYGDVVITGMELTRENAGNMAVNLVLDSAKTNIVMLHGQTVEGNSENVPNGISLPQLRGKNIDYLALGHLHTYRKEKLDDRGVYCYCGCMEGRGFDECGTKGFVEVFIEDDKVTSAFVPFSSRQFREVKVELTPEDNMLLVMGKVDEALHEIPPKDAVRLVLTGYTDMDFEVDIPRIYRTHNANHYFLKINDKTQAKIDYSSFLHDMTLKGEFVRLMAQEDIPEQRKAKITQLGMKALLGEELED